MKNSIRFIFILLAISLFITLASQISYADNYEIKPIILIPQNWKGRITQGDLEQYKNGILSNLNSVQQFYANKFNGKTFSFNRSVDVIYSLKDITEGTLSDQYAALNSPEVIKMERGKIKAVWVVGSQVTASMYAYSNGPELDSEAGKAVMPYEDLLAASGQGAGEQQQFAKTALAHELGHAFGATFSDSANGHPCTEVSTDKCKAGVETYAPAIEWTSVMGYGNPYNQFPNLFFNNTVINPEIQEICQNPFIKCPSIPQPIESKPGDKIIITELNPNTIIAGQSFEIRGSGLNQITHFRLIKTPDLVDMASTQDRIRKSSEKSDGRVVLQTPEDLVAANTESAWTILGTGPATGNLYTLLGYTGRLTIKGKLNNVVLNGQVEVTCGPNKNPVPDKTVYLLPQGNDVTLAKSITDKSGSASLSYTITNATSNTEYHVIPDPFRKGDDYIDAVAEDGSPVAKITIPQPPKDVTVTINFNYPECPEKSPLGSPTPLPSAASSPLPTIEPSPISSTPPTPPQTGTQETTNVIISNYSDFKAENNIGDVGSPTETNVPSGSTVIWTLSTLNSEPNKRVYLREITGDRYSDYIVLLGDNEQTEVAGIKLTAKIVKKIVKETILLSSVTNEQDHEVDINNPQDITVRLNGTEGEARKFNIPYIKEYSDGEIQHAAFDVDYQPIPTPTPAATCAPTTCRYTQAVDASVCASEVQLVEGTGCTGDYCQGCTYVPGCSPEPTCAGSSPSPAPSETPTPSGACTPYDDNPYPQCGGNCPQGNFGSNHLLMVTRHHDSDCNVSYSCVDQGTPAGQCGNTACTAHTEDPFTQCGGTCPDGRVIPSNHVVQVYKHIDSACNASYTCGNDLGAIAGQCGNTACTPYDDNPYPQCGGNCPQGNFGSNHLLMVTRHHDSDCNVSYSCVDQGTPAGQCGNPSGGGNCPFSGDNCVYSTQDGQCYSGYTTDISTCNWASNGQCLNPGAGCNYSCGPVACP